MKRFLLVISSTVFIFFAKAQKLDNTFKTVDFATTFGSSQASFAASYLHNWKLGKKQKFAVGVGVRLTSTFGRKLDYTTAGPAKLTRGTSTPFLVVFSEQKTQNWDTLTVQKPQTNALNFMVNFSYNFSTKLSGGLNIDLIGLTFGQKSSAVFVSNGVLKTEPVAKPSAFNLLLTGDNDLGTLNSEFFLKYSFNKRWALRGVYQFLFTEYTTTTLKQIAPDGTQVDRFRNKSNNIGLGVTYTL